MCRDLYIDHFSGSEFANIVVFNGSIPAESFLCGYGFVTYWSLWNFSFPVVSFSFSLIINLFDSFLVSVNTSF